MQSAPRDHR